MGTRLRICMVTGFALSGAIIPAKKCLFATENVTFLPGGREPLSTQNGILDSMVVAGKADRNLVFLIKEHTESLKPSSLAYLAAKVRGLRIFQELVRKGVDPSQIEFTPIVPPKGKVDIVEVDTREAGSPASTKMVTPVQGGASGDRDFIINFASASAEPMNLSSERLALFLKSVGQAGNDALVIEGYTDSTGNPDYNKALSELRALRTYEILARAGLPPYRIDTRGMGVAKVVGGKAQTEAEKQSARRVIIRWVTDEKIAAIAAAEDKKVEAQPAAKTPEPVPAPEVKIEPAPVEQAKVEHSASVWQIFPFAGVLAPTGSFADVTKPAPDYGIGGSRALFDIDGKGVRGNILLGHSVLSPKDSDLSGDLNITFLNLRADYMWSTGAIKPFVGLGLGLYIWDGAITQTSSGASHEKSTKDSGVSVAAGFDSALTQGLNLSPELSWNKAGGAFSASFLTVNLALRWDL